MLARDAEGRLIRYDAAAVVLTTGGFQGARDELTRHIGPNADRLLLRSNPGSVGDGLRMARSAGAGGTTAMSTFYGHLIGYPINRFEPQDYLPASQYYSGSTVFVNLRGERFVDETEGDELLNQAVTFQPQARGVLIFDDHVRRTEGTEEPFPGLGVIDRYAVAVEAGARHAEAETLEDLVAAVAAWGVDGMRLTRTLERYVEVAAAGGGVADGVPVAAGARPPRTGPFYALMVQPSITFTFGGIRTDTAGAALDHDGRPIPGLYAAGADIGGLSNYGYAGGLAPGYITGRWAGASAARAVSTAVGPTPWPARRADAPPRERRGRHMIYTADVLVIGGGGSGMSAAISAATSGASVIVLEKCPQVGGQHGDVRRLLHRGQHVLPVPGRRQRQHRPVHRGHEGGQRALRGAREHRAAPGARRERRADGGVALEHRGAVPRPDAGAALREAAHAQCAAELQGLPRRAAARVPQARRDDLHLDARGRPAAQRRRGDHRRLGERRRTTSAAAASSWPPATTRPPPSSRPVTSARTLPRCRR